MFISDQLRVVLISETLEAQSPQRRRAAKILLEMEGGAQTQTEHDHLEAICASAGQAVAAEAQALLQKLGLFGSLHPRAAQGRG